MKIQVLSDLHLEFGKRIISFDHAAEVFILAGDVDLGKKGIEWILENISKPVIYVLGNHEYYGGYYPKTLDKIREIAKNTHVNVLENDFVDIEGVRFHGATLWTDFSIFGDLRYYGFYCQERMNDYKKIKLSPLYSKLRSIDTYRIHTISKKWLETSLSESSHCQNIVVTHHAPCQKSLPEHFANDSLSSAYVSNLEDLIEKFKPKYWIHGHIHQFSHYKIFDTEIICNPMEYLDEEYNGF